jgi:hypothetical protein
LRGRAGPPGQAVYVQTILPFMWTTLFVIAGNWIEGIVQLVVNSFSVVIMLQFELLALAAWGCIGWFIEHGLLTSSLGGWYGQSSLVVVIVISALAVWAFRTSLGGRSLFPVRAIAG